MDVVSSVKARKPVMRRMFGFVCGAAVALILTACGNDIGQPQSNHTEFPIVSGSENKALQPIIEEWGRDNDLSIHVTYLALGR
jgi:hypothetical protein